MQRVSLFTVHHVHVVCVRMFISSTCFDRVWNWMPLFDKQSVWLCCVCVIHMKFRESSTWYVLLLCLWHIVLVSSMCQFYRIHYIEMSIQKRRWSILCDLLIYVIHTPQLFFLSALYWIIVIHTRLMFLSFVGRIENILSRIHFQHFSLLTLKWPSVFSMTSETSLQ